MSANSFGKIFVLNTFGESHGKAIGGIIDGCPAGINISEQFIQAQLDRRKPGQSKITTQRKESDKVQILSGIFEGKSLGTPIGFIIPNENQKSKDYSHLKGRFRPSHADFTYHVKYGHRDYRGGGRASARETACRVVGGAIAQQILALQGVKIQAFVQQVGNIALHEAYQNLDLNQIDSNLVRCPHAKTAEKMQEHIAQAKKEGDSLGGIIRCVISGVPAGWGEPVFDRLEADLAKAMLSINASKGFSIGSGFMGTQMRGSEHNDEFTQEENKVKTISNRSGGVQGGISNGMDIYFDVAFKPVATLLQKQQILNEEGNSVEVQGRGRHDPCVLPRAVPIVDGMAALVLVDHFLRNLSAKA